MNKARTDLKVQQYQHASPPTWSNLSYTQIGSEMVQVTVLHPNPRGAKLDVDYYLCKRMPLVPARGQ